jgi:cellulose synthase/poly-beta-1,6-N-acetylglucosamine synthase-like glycosyltransferase
LQLLPQYGGTVGGVRRRALNEIGGFDDDILAEDTDITFKLFLHKWIVIYQNSCECYEEVPENWDVRVRQIGRWAKGHNQVLFKEFKTLVKNKDISFFGKVDATLLLGIFLMGPVMFVAWGLAQIVYYTGHTEQSLVVVSFITFLTFSSFGNFALFFEIGTAAFLDGFHRRIRLLPLGVGFFFVSLTTVSKTFFKQIWDDKILKKEMVWQKTERFREKP